jgi:hypothetical protein
MAREQGMRNYAEIKEEPDLKVLYEACAGFCDCLIVDVRLTNRSLAVHKIRVPFSPPMNMRLVIHTHKGLAELVLLGVDSFRLEYLDSSQDPACESRFHRQWNNGEVTITLVFEQGEIKCNRLFWRIHPFDSDIPAIVQSEVPAPDAVPAEQIEPGWRQCSGCADAWQEVGPRVYSYCPACGRLTEYVGTGKS